jgi:hypothetical protein
MPPCPGCGAQFIGRGFGLHLANTINSPCVAVRAAADFISDSDSDPDTEQFGQDRAGNFPTRGGTFQGDFFGDNYTAGDLGYISEPEEFDVQSDCESDDEGSALDIEETLNAQFGDGWEPPRAAVAGDADSDMEDTTERVRAPPSRATRTVADDHFHAEPVVEKFPGGRAGEPISQRCATSAEEQYSSALGNSTNLYAPFVSKMDWDIARWAKLRGSGSTAFTDLLQIPGVRQVNTDVRHNLKSLLKVQDALGLSYNTSVQLNKVIDEKLPGRPKFERSEIVVGGEAFDLYSRNIIDCVRALFGDTDFAPYLFVVPERHYADKDKTIRLYHNMHTGKWWWSTQVSYVQSYKHNCT